MKQNFNKHSIPVNDIPDIEIVDLESENMQDTDSGNLHSNSVANVNDNSRRKSSSPKISEAPDAFEELDDLKESETYEENKVGRRSSASGIRRFFNLHVLFVLVFVIVIGVLGYRLTHWGQKISQSEIFKDGQGSYDDSWDSILPLTDENGQMIINEASNIVLFGNAPFADDRDSSDSLASLIAKETGATVYNCSISGSYMAAQRLNYDPSYAPMDAYCLYWLVSLACGAPLDGYYSDAAQSLGDNTPPEAEEVVNTLKTLDFNTIDTIAIMYDASDYLMGHAMYSDENPTDPMQFTGNLEASIELLQGNYPDIRIIVMSPTYAYAIDEESGDYVSSDIYIYNNRDVLSTYVIKECYSANIHSVSFMDNLYGSVTEDNADEYLSDNLHLNVKGRELIAKRFEYFLNYYAKDYASQEN